LTRLEATELARRVAAHDPPTIAAYFRQMLAFEFNRPRSRPPEK
jgi:hypothetical protein